MPRPPRADEAGGLYHALNRSNMRATIFKKHEDDAAFEQILAEGLQLYEIDLLCPTTIIWFCDAVRNCAQRGRPLGDEGWVEAIARRLNLESTMRLRSRPRVRFPDQEPNKEA